METSFFTGFGHLCRFIIIAVLAVFGINATLYERPITISSSSSAGVHMVEFRGGTSKNKKIELNWKLSQQARFRYTVEKSRDGENFIQVESRDIRNASDGNYSWIDQFPKVLNCYRLKMTDEAGRNFYSKVLVVQTFKTGQVNLVSATPDLSLNDINVDVDLKERAMVTMNIVNRNGEIVMQQKESADIGVNQFRIRGSNKLTPGDYYLNVIINGEDRLMVHLVKS